MPSIIVRLKGPCADCADTYPPGHRPDTIRMDHDEDGHPMIVVGEGGTKPAEYVYDCHLMPFLTLVGEDGTRWLPQASGWVAQPKT